MLDVDIVWVKITYPDNSESIFRATRCKQIIEDVLGQKELRDIFSGETLSDLYVFDVSSKCFVNISNINRLEEFKSKPKFSREVDKFASCFIR